MFDALQKRSSPAMRAAEEAGGARPGIIGQASDRPSCQIKAASPQGGSSRPMLAELLPYERAAPEGFDL
jgi:hypothetical protein